MPVELEPRLGAKSVFRRLDRPRMCLVCGGLFYRGDEMVRLIRDDGMECWLCPTCYEMPLSGPHSVFTPTDHPDSRVPRMPSRD